MTVQTIRPNFDVKKKSVSYSTGSSAFALIDDEPAVDSSYIYVLSGITYPSAYAILGLGSMGAVSATQRIKQCRFRLRVLKHASDPGWFGTVNTKFADGATGKPDKYPDGFYTTNGTTVQAKTGPWHTKAPNGKEFTKAFVDAMQIHLAWYYSQGANHVNLRIEELYVDVDVRDQPTVTAVTVVGNDISTRPEIQWTYNENADGDPQKNYRVKIFSAAQYGITGFDPEKSPCTYDSGELHGGTENHILTRDLSVGVTYKAYVKAAQDFNGSAWYSAWTALSSPGTTFTITPVPPPTPTLTLTADPAVPNLRNILAVTSNLNFLTAQQASLEDGTTTGWENVSNAVLASDATIFADGLRSLKLTPTTGGVDVIARTLSGVNGVRVIGGLTYTASFFVRTGVTARTVNCRIYWWKKDGTAASTASNDGTGSADTTSFVQRTATFTAPADAWYASVSARILVPAAAEAHYVDKADIHLGSGTAFSAGGFMGIASTIIECAWVTNGENNLAHPQLWTSGDFEKTSNGFFTSGTNSDVAYDTSTQYQGIGSIHWIVKDTTSKLYIGWPSGTEVNPSPIYPLAAVPGRVYSFSLRAKAGASFSSQLNIAWLDKDGNVISTVNNGGMTITTSWIEYKKENITAPALAVWAKAYLDNTGSVVDKDVYVSAVQWYLGATVPAISNLTAQGVATFWYPVHGADVGDLMPSGGDATAYVHDFEVPPGYSVVYRARNFSPATDTLPALSSDPTPYIMTMMTPPGVYTLSLPEDGLLRMQIRVTKFDRAQHEESTTFYPLRPAASPNATPRPVVITDFIGGHDGMLEVVTLTDEEWQALTDLLNLQKTLWLVHADFGAQYLRVGGQGDRQWSVKRIQNNLNWMRRVQIPVLEVDRPV